MNNKGITKIATILLIFIIVIVVGVAVAIGSNVQPTSNNLLDVYIDDTKFVGNITATNQLDWGAVSAGNSYTKNFTVFNPTQQTYTLLLLTGEPSGTTQAWSLNNTQLPAMSTASATLTLTLSTTPSLGTYNWRLLATNSSLTPTASPTPATIPSYMLTLNIDGEGISKVNVTLGSEKFVLTPGDVLPRTYSFKSGTTITIETTAIEGYSFNTYLLGDGTIKSSNPATWTAHKADLDVTPNLLIG